MVRLKIPDTLWASEVLIVEMFSWWSEGDPCQQLWGDLSEDGGGKCQQDHCQHQYERHILQGPHNCGNQVGRFDLVWFRHIFKFFVDSHRSPRMQLARKWRKGAPSILWISPEGKMRKGCNSSESIPTISARELTPRGPRGTDSRRERGSTRASPVSATW